MIEPGGTVTAPAGGEYTMLGTTRWGNVVSADTGHATLEAAPTSKIHSEVKYSTLW